MMRSNNAIEGTIKEFKNGNLSIKFDRDYINEHRNETPVELVSWLLDSLDSYIIGEEFCLSNYDMGCQVYNCHSDLVYIMSFTDLDKAYHNGSTLKLYARTPDTDDLETINEFFND